MFDLGGFQYTSSELLGRYVDVVMDNSMHPQMSESILKDATAI